MDLETLFWAAVVAKVFSIPAVAYLAWVGRGVFQCPTEQKEEQAWKYAGAEERHETGSLVPGIAH